MVADFGIALWHILFLLLAVAYQRRHDFAPKRLLEKELGAQRCLVRGLVEYGLRGTHATREDVEDLTQEVMLAAWVASEGDKYRPDPTAPPLAALRSWLWGIAHHCVAHHLDSARARREVISGTAVGVRIKDPTPSPEDSIGREENRLTFLAAVAEISRDQAAVLIAHDLDEETMNDIAERLGTPVSTLYKWRARGIAALKRALRLEDG